MDLFKKVFDDIKEVDRKRMTEEERLRTFCQNNKGDNDRAKEDLKNAASRLALQE